MQIICDLTNTDFSDVVEIEEERLGKDHSYLLDSDKVRDTFNWNESFKLRNGIEDTIRWVKENINYFSSIPWTYQHKE